jgi:replicative DNA helicase
MNHVTQEHEVRVLGAILADPSAYWKAAEHIKSGADFADLRHGWIWRAISELAAGEGTVDFIAVGDHLEKLPAGTRKPLEEAGGRDYLRTLALESESSANVGYYAGVIHEAAGKRQLLEQVRKIFEQGTQASTSLDEIEDALRDASQELAKSTVHRRLPSLADLSGQIREGITNRKDGKHGAPINLRPIAKAIGKWWPGVHYLVGETKSGKSQLVLQEALAAAREGWVVAYLSLELSPEEVWSRLVADASQSLASATVSWSAILKGTANESAVSAAAAEIQPILERVHVYASDALALTVDEITRLAEQARQVAPEGRLLIVLDYLQAIGGGGELRERIRSAALRLGAWCNRHKVPALVVSSANTRGADSILRKKVEGNPALYVGLGKESGEIEYSGQTVCAVVAPNHTTRELVLAAGRMVEPQVITGLLFEGGFWLEAGGESRV